MSMWGSNALVVRNAPTVKHEFNSGVLGRGVCHRNRAMSARRVVVRILAGVYWRQATVGVAPLLGDWIGDGIDCLVDSGATFSVFRGEIAEQLGLSIANVFLEEVVLADNRRRMYWWCAHEMAVSLGAGFIPVRVRFPVVPLTGGMGYAWDRSFPGTNILGMEDVLTRRMLCFTPEVLFVFSRR